MDILVYVDRLEELFRKGARIPLTRRVIVDEQVFLDLIDQMRLAIPEEIRQAKRVSDERERILAAAEEDAERTRAEAQRHAALLLSQQGIRQLAEEEARKIKTEALAYRDQLIAEADQYCIGVLTALHDELMALLQSTRAGVQHLQEKAAASAKDDTRHA